MSNIGFPQTGLVFTDQQGRLTRDALYFLQLLWQRSGGSNGASTPELVASMPEDGGTEEIRAQVYSLKDAAEQSPIPQGLSVADVEGIVFSMLPGPVNKADLGLANVQNTDLSTWPGTTNLTTLGTVTTGTWQATAVGAAYGGTGLTTYAVGDLLYANTTSSLARLADVATGSVLTSGGVGVAPGWSTLSSLTANPSASVGLSAVNGSAATFMRSDAAPALSQSIAPTWTGDHAWSNAKITPDQLKGIVGTTTNNSANAGSVGEYMTASATASSTGTGKYFDIASLNLTAGDWDVSGVVQFSSAGATWSRATAGIGTATGDNGAGMVSGDTQTDEIFASSSTTPTAVSMSLPAVRKSLSGTTTIYLKGYSVFSAGTPSATGRISARRVR
jgi:hypothetical protein